MGHSEPEGEGQARRPFMPRPGRTGDSRLLFHTCMAEVLALVGGKLPPGPGPTDLDAYEWQHTARAAVVAGLPQAGPWTDAVFDTLMRAIVHDPNPSFNRQLIEPALTAAGRRRVQETLLDILDRGTNAEKAGAARAWYWSRQHFDRPELAQW